MSRTGSHTGHRILAANAEGIEHQRKRIHDDPALQGFTPHRRKQDCADKHDDNILDQTPATSNPVADNADADLAEDNTHDFEVADSSNPILGADFIRFPTRRPHGLEEGREIPDRKEGIPLESDCRRKRRGGTFDEHAHTSDNVGAKIVADRLEGILLQF